MSLFKFQPLRLALLRSFHQLPAIEATQNSASNDKLPFVVKRHPELLLNVFVRSDEKLDDEKWVKIREELLSKKIKEITPVNVDALIVDTCCAVHKHEAAIDYINHLKSQNIKLNIAIIAKYFRILFTLEKLLTPMEETEVLRLYDEIRKEYPVLDPSTVEACVIILGKTSRWRECLELIKMIEKGAQLSAIASSAIIEGALRNDEPEIAWQYFRRMPPRLKPRPKVYYNFLNYYDRTSKSAEEFDKNIQQVFNFFDDYGIHPRLEVMQYFSDVMAKFGWDGKQTSINNSGVCRNCGCRLQELNLTPKDFQHLSNVFLNKVLVGSDVYNKTTPAELNHFQSFINDAQATYDVVVDGLNVAFVLRNNKGGSNLGAALARVVRTLKNQNKKVLVLGRRHMRKWDEAAMRYVTQNATMFYANDLSQDDPYLLYATLRGGLNTYFVSSDMMRQHLFKLPAGETRKIFKCWQITRQIEVKALNQRLILLHPPKYNPTTQKDPNGWHIPCVENHIIHQPATNEPSPHWYCLQKRSTAKSKR